MQLDHIREQCWNEALHCFGTSSVFNARAQLLQWRLRFLAFLGLALPASVGASFASFGANAESTIWLLALSSVLGIGQLLLSIWALTSKWDDALSYALESHSANRVLHDKFVAFAKEAGTDSAKDELRFKLLVAECDARSVSDERQGITENEKRYGMRAALRQLQRSCAACKQVPTSMTPTYCDVCGSFTLPRY